MTRWFGGREGSSPTRNFPTTSFTTGTPTLTLSSSTLPPLPTTQTSRSNLAVPPQMAFDQHHAHESTHRGIQLSRTRPQSVTTAVSTAIRQPETAKERTNEFAIDSDDDEFFDDVEFGDVVVANATHHVEREAHSRRISTNWKVASLLVVSVCLVFVVAVLLTVAKVTSNASAAATAPPHPAWGDALSQSFTNSAVLEHIPIQSVTTTNNNNNSTRRNLIWLERNCQ